MGHLFLHQVGPKNNLLELGLHKTKGPMDDIKR